MPMPMRRSFTHSLARSLTHLVEVCHSEKKFIEAPVIPASLDSGGGYLAPSVSQKTARIPEPVLV